MQNPWKWNGRKRKSNNNNNKDNNKEKSENDFMTKTSEYKERINVQMHVVV